MNTLVDRLSVPVTASVPKSAIADDMAMIRAASELTRDLVQPSARIYWTDFLASTFIGYAGIADEGRGEEVGPIDARRRLHEIARQLRRRADHRHIVRDRGFRDRSGHRHRQAVDKGVHR